MNVMFVEQLGRCSNGSRGRLMCRIILQQLLLLQLLLMTAHLVFHFQQSIDCMNGWWIISTNTTNRDE